jgi:hypothetical protein
MVWYCCQRGIVDNNIITLFNLKMAHERAETCRDKLCKNILSCVWPYFTYTLWSHTKQRGWLTWKFTVGRSRWPRDLRRRAACLHLMWVRIPPGAWMFVCCVLLWHLLCDELITRPEEFYRLWCVFACRLGTSWIRRPWSSRVSSLSSDRVSLYEIKLHTYCCVIVPQYSCS